MKEKILIINDEEPVREMMRLFLQKQYEVVEASDGATGLQAAEKEQPQLILLDVMMPGINGYEVCKQLKANERTKEIPVIFLSSLSDPKDKIKGLEAGGVDFITRASDKGEILARVQTHLKIRGLTHDLIEKNEQLRTKQAYLDEDLKAAANIQKSLLPNEHLNIRGLSLSWKNSPCDAIGGDIFGIIPIQDDLTALYILDVSGHGVPAAMVTVSVSQHLHELTNRFQTNHDLTITQPASVLKSLDKEFPLERFDKFFSIFYLIINTKEKTFTYCNGGHPPAILLNQQSPYQLLADGGTVIGVNEDLPYKEGKGALAIGSKIILYTDGVTEYIDGKGGFYGMKRFSQVFEQAKDEPSNKIIIDTFKDLETFGNGVPAADDVSILIAQVT
jgi:sigma-B regulation protein RsbU (phosphoserine phosphatase)